MLVNLNGQHAWRLLTQSCTGGACASPHAGAMLHAAACDACAQGSVCLQSQDGGQVGELSWAPSASARTGTRSCSGPPCSLARRCGKSAHPASPNVPAMHHGRYGVDQLSLVLVKGCLHSFMVLVLHLLIVCFCQTMDKQHKLCCGGLAKCRYGKAMFFLGWHEIRQTLYEALPPGVVEFGHKFESYTDEGEDGIRAALQGAPRGLALTVSAH